MAVSAEKITQLIEPAITAMGYELVGCELFSRGRRHLLRVYIDSEQGTGIEDCTRVSRQVSALLDVEDLIPGSYDLEVSSPGLDRPLFKLAHYQKVIGKKIRVRLKVPQEGRRNFSGVLTEVTSEKAALIDDNQTWILPLKNIEKANVDYKSS